MKKAVAIMMVLAMVIGAVACFAGCDVNKDKEPVATSYVSMDINPSIRFVLDKDQKIMSYSCENDDALVLLYGEVIVGMDIQEASQKIMDLAVKMGYLTKDNCGVQVSVSSDDSKVESNILDKIGVAVTNTDEKLAFEINYDKEGSFVLNYQLAKLKEQNADNEYYQNLTAGKLRLINSAMAADFSLKMDDAVKMSTQQLLEIVDEAYNNLEDFSTKAFEEAKLAAEQVYQTAVVTAQEAVYITKYMEYKGVIEGGLAVAQYGGLSIAAKSVELLAKSVVFAQDTADKLLAEDDVLAIATQLGVDVEALKDSQGNVTVDSIGAYVDKVAKNSADGLTQDMRDKLDGAVEKLEESKEQLQDKPLSQDIVNKIQAALASIEIKDIDFDSITVEDLKDISVELEKKAADMKEKMDASLTDEQKQNIADAQQQAVAKLGGALEQYNQALAKAEQEAKDTLQRIKNSRLESLAPQS
ncbi:MAG: hypothetical protein K2K85_02345 [Clostridia bacterium]|nr:hypothetical protein [Clostridia bacterium]